MAKSLQSGIVPQTCGLGWLGYFRSNQSPGGKSIGEMTCCGGAGWMEASFTNQPGITEAYKEAYKELREKWQIVYQSPVRVNTRTGFKFFFCVYDCKKVSIDNTEFKWPSKGLSA